MKRHVRAIILKTAKKQAGWAAAIIVCVLAAVVFTLIPPMILGNIVDALTAGKSVNLVSAVAYFACLAIAGLAESAREGSLIVFGQKITHALRGTLMEKMTRLSADQLNQLEPGSVAARFVGDVNTVENLFTGGIISMFTDACRIFGIAAVIWFQNRGLACVLCALVPILFGFTRHVQKRMLSAQTENRRAVSRASACVPQTIANIRTIHTLGKEEYVAEKYDRYIEEGYRATQKTNFYDAVYSPVILLVNAAVVTGVMLAGASGKTEVLNLFGMSAGTAVAVINYIAQIFSPIESLGMEIQTIQSAVAGVKRIDAFLNAPEREIPSKKVSLQTDAPEIEFRDVSFGYDEKKVLQNLSFQVEKGERVTLKGRTGAGKSTVFKLLMGLYAPEQGKVLLEGVPAEAIPDTMRRELFGLVEQNFHCVRGTVRDQITLFDDSVSNEDVVTIAKLVHLDETIRTFPKGYDTPCTPDLFSQGQWQLLNVARAAAKNPKLLLLDEITANLDAVTEREVLEALQRVSEHRTVVSISHRTNAQTGRIIPIG